MDHVAEVTAESVEDELKLRDRILEFALAAICESLALDEPLACAERRIKDGLRKTFETVHIEHFEIDPAQIGFARWKIWARFGERQALTDIRPPPV